MIKLGTMCDAKRVDKIMLCSINMRMTKIEERTKSRGKQGTGRAKVNEGGDKCELPERG